MPKIGTLGASVAATTTFDGWGTIHLLDANTLQEVDNYSIPEAIDPAFASGSGTMSVHEVAMDKSENLGYLSWYDAGMRVVRFGPSGIEEVGHYIAPGGNDFWGVEAHRLPGDAAGQYPALRDWLQPRRADLFLLGQRALRGNLRLGDGLSPALPGRRHPPS